MACTDDESGGRGAEPGGGTPLDDLVAASEGDGNSVQLAGTTPFMLEDCGALPSCFASNATSPYGLWNLPPPPGGVLPSDGVLPPRTPPGTAPAFQFRPDEVLIYVGRTPPSATYFSYAPYIFSRLSDVTGERVPIFASLSDALNQVNLKTAEGGPFDAETVIIVTAHAEMERRARSWLIEAGYAASIINTLPLPADVLRLGTEPEADTLMLLQRFALFEDEAEGSRYLEDIPADVLRITPDEPLPADPIAVPARTPRGTGTTEEALAPALDALEAAVRARHGEPSAEPFTMASAALVTGAFDPAVCIQNVAECKGEVSDTTYSAGPLQVVQGSSTLRLTNDPADFFIAIGANHEATGKATYSNLVVTNWAKQAGVAAVDSRHMAGSAAVYLPDHPEREKLFAVKITRECDGAPHCLEVPVSFPGVALDQDILFLFRAYLEPGTSVSPGPAELLTERVLHYVP